MTMQEGGAEPSRSEDDSRAQWRAWAAASGLEPHGLAAARAATKLLRAGASVSAAVSAGFIAASRGTLAHVQQLHAENAWIQSVIEDLKRENAPTTLIERYQARRAAVNAAAQLYYDPTAQAVAQQDARYELEVEELRRRTAEDKVREEREAAERSARELRLHQEREEWKQRAAASAPVSAAPPVQELSTTVIPPPAREPVPAVVAVSAAPVSPAPSEPPEPPTPPRPSLQEFLTEHSILIVSYTGAFLLFIATLLFELYTIKLNGGIRFAGVASLDLIFAAAGIACLRSRGLRIVGHTYLAIFALLAPLVFVAAYVFLDLGGKGISTDQAFGVAGVACCVLYVVLTLRLKLHAYGVLAMLALPVAWWGITDLSVPIDWRGPALSPLPLVYTLVLFESPRLQSAGDRFARFALPFVHAAAALAAGATLYTLIVAPGRWIPWVLASALAGLAVSYTAFRALGGPRYGAALALSALGLAVAAGIHDSSLAMIWHATALSPLVAFYTIVQLRPAWLGPRAQLFSSDARWFVHAGAALVLIALVAEISQVGGWIHLAVAMPLGVAAAGYALNRRLGGQEPEAVAALTALGLGWAAAVHDTDVGAWEAVVLSPLVPVYAIAHGRSFSRYGEYFVHAAALGVISLIAIRTPTTFVWWANAAALAGVTAGYVVHRLYGGREPSGTFGLIALGGALLCGAAALGIGSWTAATIAALAAVYAVITWTRHRIVPPTAPYFIHAALAVGATQLAFDLFSRDQWNPTVVAATAAAFAVAYLLDVTLNRRRESAVVALLLFGIAWTVATDALQLGRWRGAAISPLVAAYAVLAFRGSRFGVIGGLLSTGARWLAHGAAATAVMFAFGDMFRAGFWIEWTGTATMAGVTAGYLLFALLGASVEGAFLCQLAFGAAWTLASNDLHLGVWRGPSVTLLVALYGLIAYRGHTTAAGVFGRYAKVRVHGAAAVALALTTYAVVSAGGWVSWVLTATFGGLAAAYFLICVLGAPVEAALISLASFGLAWTAAAHDLGLGEWRPIAVAALPALYSAIAYRGVRFGEAGAKFARHAELFIHGGAALAGFVLIYELAAAGAWIPWAAASTFGVVAGAYLFACWLGGGIEMALVAKAAFGIAWISGAYDLVPGRWWPAAVAPLVALYSVAAFRGGRAGAVGEKVARHAVWYADLAALAVLVLLPVEIALAGQWLPWSVTVAAAGVGAGYVLYTWLGGGLEGASVAEAALLAGWVALAQDLQLAGWRGSMVAAAGLLLSLAAFRGARLGRVGALFARRSEAYIHIAVAAGVLWVVFDPAHFLDNAPVAAVLGVTATVYALYAWLSGRQPALLVTAVAVTLAAIFESEALSLSLAYLTTELTVLAGLSAAVAHLSRDTILRYGLRVWMALQLVVVAGLGPSPHVVAAACLLVATAVVVWVARDSKTPEWLLFATGLFVVDWFQFAQTVLPPPANPTIDTYAMIFSPLPVVLGLVGLGTRAATTTRWAWPLYAYAGTGAFIVVAAALTAADSTLAGAALLAYSVVLYAAGSIDRSWLPAVGAGVTTAFGFGMLLYGAAAAPEWYPVAGFGTSAVLYVLQVPWEMRFARNSDWIQAHRITGLGGAALSALSSFAFTSFVTAHSWGALAAAAGMVGFGALVVIDGRRHARPEFDYLGATLMSLSGLWIAYYFGASNLEWYVVLPGAVIVGSGVRLPYDQRVRLPYLRMIAQVLTGAGMILILGTSAVLTVLEPPNAWLYTSALVVEGVVALLAGIGFKSRVLAIGGSAGVALSAVRAVFVGITQGWLPVWAVFFAVSMILLGLGAALALMRDRLPDARLRLSDTWRNWN